MLVNATEKNIKQGKSEWGTIYQKVRQRSSHEKVIFKGRIIERKKEIGIQKVHEHFKTTEIF